MISWRFLLLLLKTFSLPNFWNLDTLSGCSPHHSSSKIACFFSPTCALGADIPLQHLLYKVLFALLQEVTRSLDLLFVQQHQRPQRQVELCRVLEQAAADPVILQINQTQHLISSMYTQQLSEGST